MKFCMIDCINCPIITNYISCTIITLFHSQKISLSQGHSRDCIVFWWQEHNLCNLLYNGATTVFLGYEIFVFWWAHILYSIGMLQHNIHATSCTMSCIVWASLRLECIIVVQIKNRLQIDTQTSTNYHYCCI